MAERNNRRAAEWSGGHDGHAEAPVGGPSKWIVLAVAGSGVYMATLDSGIVNVALPTLTHAFDAPVVQTQWVILGYLLCITGLLLPAGRLADIAGRKKVFLGGFVIFTLASALCGLAPSLWALVAARVVQGVGGAMMQANSLALVTQAFPGSERGQALGLNMAIVSAGLLSGPVVGGLIIEWFGWPWIFFVNVPIGIVATLFGVRQLREAPVRPGQRFDLPGAALFLLLVVGLLLTLNAGGQQSWTAPPVLVLGAATVGAGLLLWAAERRAAQPMIEVALFRNQGFRASILAAFMLFLGVSHTQLLLPFYLERVVGLTTAQVGLLLVTGPATVLVLAPIAGALSDRLGSRLLATIGALVGVAGLVSMALLRADSTVVDIVPRQMLVAIGMALFGSPNGSALFGSLPRERYGVGGAYQSLTRNLGQSIGQASAAALWTAVVMAAAGGLDVNQAPVEALMAGFGAAFAVAAVLALLGAVISLVARPRAAVVAAPAAAREPDPAPGPR